MTQQYTGTMAVASAIPTNQPISPLTKKTPMLNTLMVNQQQQQQQQQQHQHHQHQHQHQMQQQQQLQQHQMQQHQHQQLQHQQQHQQNLMGTYSVAAINNRPAYMNQQQQQQNAVHNQQHMSPVSSVHLQNPIQGGINYSPQIMQQQQQRVNQAVGSLGKPASSSMHTHCIRSGCPNAAIPSPDWENEYCSNECVVSHCRYFTF